MKVVTCTGVLLSLAMIGCGSDPDSSTTNTSASLFDPPAAPEGYTRIRAQTIHDVKPGGDVTYCQYIMAPFDRDMDVLDVSGYQSEFGHHAVALSYPDDGSLQVGDSIQCMGAEFTADPNSAGTGGGTFLGGIAGPGGEGQTLPEGVAFRLPKGNGILLNVHYLNTGTQTTDGDAVLDVKFAEIDPNRHIAAMFLNMNMSFDLAPSSRTTSSIDCVAQSDVQILMMTNHMHEYGANAKTEVVRADTGAIEVLRDDPMWEYEMQFNIQYTRWTVEQPFVLRAGDTIRTSCEWNNTTTEALAFPREMCIGVGFALATGENPTAPACIGGTWYTSVGS
jgi:hypothetical protein